MSHYSRMKKKRRNTPRAYIAEAQRIREAEGRPSKVEQMRRKDELYKKEQEKRDARRNMDEDGND